MKKIAYNSVEQKIVNIVSKKTLTEKIEDCMLKDVDAELDILSKFSSNYTFNLLSIFQTSYIREIGQYKNYDILDKYHHNILRLLSSKIMKLIDVTSDRYIYGIIDCITESILESILDLIIAKDYKTEDDIRIELGAILTNIKHVLFFDEPIPNGYNKVYSFLLQYINSYLHKSIIQMIYMYQISSEGDINV